MVGCLSAFTSVRGRSEVFLEERFKVLCVIASLALSGTVWISCALVKEKEECFEHEVRLARDLVRLHKEGDGGGRHTEPLLRITDQTTCNLETLLVGRL